MNVKPYSLFRAAAEIVWRKEQGKHGRVSDKGVSPLTSRNWLSVPRRRFANLLIATNARNHKGVARDDRQRVARRLASRCARHGRPGRLSLLETQIQRLDSYPEALPRLRDHLAETKDQRAKVEQCLQKLGEGTSTLKDATMKVGANLQGLAHMMSSDEVLKHALASNAFEHFEAASYCSLAAAAEDAGEPEIAKTCEGIVQQELAMADWVWRQLPPLTHKYLQRSEAGVQAKR